MPLSIAGRPPEDQAIRVIHSALDSGVTLIDTADVYCLDDNDIGHNERLIANALKQRPGARDQVLVATKGGLTRPGGRWERKGDPAHLRLACDRSLKALGVDRIDLYQLHAPPRASSLADAVGTLGELQRHGKIRWIGLSNVSVQEIDEANEIVQVVTVQNRLNPFFREALSGAVVAHCAVNGIGFLAYSPVGGGRLNLKLPNHPVLKAIARRRNASPHAVALAWVKAQGPTVIPIPGARTEEHMKDSASAAALTLERAELAEIDQADFSRA